MRMNSCPICNGEVYIGTEDYNDEPTKVIVCAHCDLRFYGSTGLATENELIKEWNNRIPIRHIMNELGKTKDKYEQMYHELMDSEDSLPCLYDKSELADERVGALAESIDIVKKGLV